MKNEFIYNARECHQQSKFNESFQFWSIKYLSGMIENVDFITTYYHINEFKQGKPRKDYLLTERAKNTIEEKMKTPFSVYAYECPIEKTIKYIGCSVNEYARLNTAYSQVDNSRKHEWLNTLKSLNISPRLLILDTAATVLEATIKEQKHIENHRDTILNSKIISPYRRITHTTNKTKVL